MPLAHRTGERPDYDGKQDVLLSFSEQDLLDMQENALKWAIETCSGGNPRCDMSGLDDPPDTVDEMRDWVDEYEDTGAEGIDWHGDVMEKVAHADSPYEILEAVRIGPGLSQGEASYALEGLKAFGEGLTEALGGEWGEPNDLFPGTVQVVQPGD